MLAMVGSGVERVVKSCVRCELHAACGRNVDAGREIPAKRLARAGDEWEGLQVHAGADAARRADFWGVQIRRWFQVA
ncbi:MAG: hypothetical protein ACOVP8_00200 [Phycisphaerales bacterium]